MLTLRPVNARKDHGNSETRSVRLCPTEGVGHTTLVLPDDTRTGRHDNKYHAHTRSRVPQTQRSSLAPFGCQAQPRLGTGGAEPMVWPGTKTTVRLVSSAP
jgi:hypothetical protein